MSSRERRSIHRLGVPCLAYLLTLQKGVPSIYLAFHVNLPAASVESSFIHLLGVTCLAYLLPLQKGIPSTYQAFHVKLNCCLCRKVFHPSFRRSISSLPAASVGFPSIWQATHVQLTCCLCRKAFHPPGRRSMSSLPAASVERYSIHLVGVPCLAYLLPLQKGVSSTWQAFHVQLTCCLCRKAFHPSGRRSMSSLPADVVERRSTLLVVVPCLVPCTRRHTYKKKYCLFLSYFINAIFGDLELGRIDVTLNKQKYITQIKFFCQALRVK